VREPDLVARLGGDEFAILIENYRGANELADMASRLLATFKPNYGVAGRGINITASVGVCTYPHGAADCESMLSNADIALYRAKEQGRNRFCLYSADLNRLSQERLLLEMAPAKVVRRKPEVDHSAAAAAPALLGRDAGFL